MPVPAAAGTFLLPVFPPAIFTPAGQKSISNNWVPSLGFNQLLHIQQRSIHSRGNALVLP
jgi:hypothetical protein